MSFKSQMASLRSKLERELPGDSFDRLQAEAANLRASGNWCKARKAGEAAPDIQLPNRTGGIVRLRELLGGGPVVVCFCRGDWCRFCRLHLQALAEIAGEVRALGASLIAVAPAMASATVGNCAAALPFPMLVDVDAGVCQAFGLTFLPAENLRDAYTALGRSTGEERRLALPVPAVYVIDRSSMIVFSYFDTDFTNRLAPCEILAVLRRLRATEEAADSKAFPQT